MKTENLSLKRLAALVAAICMMAAMMPMLPTEARAATDVVGSGQMGDNVYWTLTADGVLTVSGTGATWDCIYYTHEWDMIPGNRVQYFPKTIIIEDGVTYLGDWLFSNLKHATDVIMADSVTNMGENVFWCCKKLVNVKLSNKIVAIGFNAFSGCGELTTITVPDSVTWLIDNAFISCISMKSIVIPQQVKMIGGGAFEHCDKLADVYYTGTEAQWNEIQIGIYNEPLFNATIHYSVAEQKEEPSTWAAAEVNLATTAGLVPGNLQKNYQSPVSRGDVAQMFINLIEKSSGKDIKTFMAEKGVSTRGDAFVDTSDEAVLAANALGIINGVGNGRFDPDGTLTRAQIAAMINRVAKTLGVDTGGYAHDFVDVSGHWVDAELGWPVSVGIINGVGDGKFDPDAELTTEQAIAITYRAFKVLAK